MGQMGRRRGGGGRKPGRLPVRYLALGVAALGLAGGVWLLLPYWQLPGQLAEEPVRQPSRLYARAPVLEVDRPVALGRIVELLEGEGYRRVAAGELAPGSFGSAPNRLEVYLRAFPTPQGPAGRQRLEATLRGGRVAALSLDGEAVQRAMLEPPLLASFHGPDLKERRPVALETLPDEAVLAVLAAEDIRFFEHHGLSAAAMLRAAWVNLRSFAVRQGGSTLTQQLVKNLYLTHERTLARKAREIALTLLIEARYDKERILQSYLNEIYWGRSGSYNLIGIGAAAHAYFGKEAADLDLAEAALLAGMIQAPADYSPFRHPERAQARRDAVLERLAELGWVSPEAATEAATRPLGAVATPVVVRRAPHFADQAAREARRRFGIRDLHDGGYTLFSTVDWSDQQRAEEALRWGLEALEAGWQKDHAGEGPLEGALVSVDPTSGAILAYVGGRDYRRSQFDRVSQARRQAGSAFKPVVYAAAFEAGKASPASYVEDAPLTVTLASGVWEPRNDDGEYRGWVTARTALEQSLNVATARVALQVGLPAVVELARGMGVSGRIDPVPSLALGAFELTPLELATVYATLAAGGVRPPVHGLAAVVDRDGRPLDGEALPPRQRVLSPQGAYLVTAVLQGVLDHGTGSTARAQGLTDPLAGKTGTTNGRRDSWFAGYSPERASLVWVGYDDNARTRLSGARAGLPIWARFAYAVRPPEGYRVFEQPPGVVTATIDPRTAELATSACPEAVTEVFLEGRAPAEVCHLHGWRTRRALDDEEEDDAHPIRRWLRRVFGNGGT